MEKRMITTDVTEEDLPLEGSLRPQTLDEYIGQEKTKKTLKIYIEAAKQRHDALDHVLFYGPPGLGKTTLSGIIANEMGTHMKVTSGPAIEKPGEMAAILNNLQEGDILFVDEIHRLNRQIEEVLYPAMEDFAIDIMIGKGASARSIRLDLPKFTLVGATTRAGLLSAPLRDRFGVMHHLGHALPQARIGREGLRRHGGALAVRPVQGQLIAHAAGGHIRLHRTGIKGIGVHAEQLLIAPSPAVQVPQQQIKPPAEIVARGGNGAAVARLAQQVKEHVGGVHHQLLLQGGHDAAPEIALFIRGIIQVVRHDNGAVPAQCAAQQIVRRHTVIVARLHNKRKARLADAVFIVA